MTSKFSTFLLLLIINTGIICAKDSVFEIPYINSPILLDGITTDEAWQQIDPLPMVMFQPVYKGEMTEKTEIKVAYDEKYIYILGNLYDSEPDKIVANTLYRDKYRGDETFGVVIDSYNDNENAKWFYVTPNGVKVDLSVTNDAQGDEFYNRNWSTFWDTSVKITDEGWFVEMRIPFSSLGFQKTNNEVIMGLIIYRYIARKAERHVYPDIAANWSHGFAKPSQAQKIKMYNIEYKPPMYFTPYILGGFDEYNSMDENNSGYQKHNNLNREIGLDIKFPVAVNMNLDLTINTDFAQAEADETQINLTRTPLFFPEKRQFFQERADIFDFKFSETNNLFYSRRIGLEEGRQVKILGGARLAGRTGKWDLGILDMQTKAIQDYDLESKNFGLIRAKRQIINNNSYVGGIVTSIIDVKGNYNINTGLDFLANYSGKEFLDFKIASTFDNRITNSFSLHDNSKIRFNFHRRTFKGLYYNVTGESVGKFYRPDMGFESRQDYKLFDAELYYGHFLKSESPIRILTPSIKYFTSIRNKKNSIESQMIQQPLEFVFKNSAIWRLTNIWWYENLETTLSFSDKTFIEAGSYSFYGINLEHETATYKTLQVKLSALASTFYDGKQYSLSLKPVWHQSKYMELSAEARLNYIEIPKRNQQEYLNIYRLQTLLALNAKLSLQILAQYNQLNRQISANTRFRYNFSEGNDLWIVYNEINNTDLYRTVPSLKRLDNRVLLVKYTYTFY